MKKKIFDNKTDKILYRVLNESIISYNPEMIDKFVMEAGNDLSSFKNILNSHLGKVSNVSIQNIIDDRSLYIQLHEKMETNHRIMSGKHSKYFNIVDMYDVREMPDNVRKLELITDDIDRILNEYGILPGYLDDLIEMSKKIEKMIGNPQ